LLSHSEGSAKQPTVQAPKANNPYPRRKSHLPNTLPPVVITSNYYAGPKVLVLHPPNNSGKDIIGYTIIIADKNPDGTMDKGRSETTSDILNILIISPMAKDPTASERIRQKDIGNNSFPTIVGTGIFHGRRMLTSRQSQLQEMRGRLTEYVEEEENKVELMMPHCHLEIALK
jgi:hypothetical protein